MKKVDLKFKRLEVTRAFPRDNSVEIKLTVNDGKEKFFARGIRLENVAEIADELIRDVRGKIRDSHKSSSISSDDILSGVVVLKIVDDEDLLLDKISRFLAVVREKFRLANSGKLSYYDIELQLRKSFVEF